MTAKMNVLRAQLEKEKALLLEELEQIKSSANSQDERREGSPFGKREEEANEAPEMEKRAALEKRIKEQMVDVEHALHKFEDGTYGSCDICGKAIDPERLEALPQAYLCMNCKAQKAKNAR